MSATATGVHTPRVSYSCPLSPEETLHDQQVGLAQAPLKSLLFTAFALGPGVHKTLCASSKSGLCFPQFCGAPAIKPQWPSKPDTLGAPPPDARSLGWGD